MIGSAVGVAADGESLGGASLHEDGDSIGHAQTRLKTFPAVERDFSLLLADGTPFAEVVEVIRSLGITELTDVEAVDVYRGGHIPEGKYSLLVRVTFQSHDATLTEAQLTDFSGRIVAALESRLGAALRAT